MTSLRWLSANAPGFEALGQDERDAVMHFALLWSLFEGTVLRTKGSARSIIDVSKRWEVGGQLEPESLNEYLKYFRNRYFRDNEFTDHFRALHFRKSEDEELVKAIIGAEMDGTGDTVAALLIIVYRLRNNLFHGRKWAYELRGSWTILRTPMRSSC